MKRDPPDRVIRTTRTSRADLIRLLKVGGGIGLDDNAQLFGYARKKKQPEQNQSATSNRTLIYKTNS